MKRLTVTIALTLMTFAIQASAQSEQKFAELGDFKLESGEVIRDFTIIMIAGVVVGTYSTFYIAVPVLYYLNLRSIGERTEKEKPAAKPAT